MAKTDLKINATDGYGKDITTTISYVNPEAGKSDILNFTQALNGLTKNTYKETERIQTVNVDLEDVPDTPTFSASITQYSAADFTDDDSGGKIGSPSNLNYNGDGDLVLDSKAIINSNLRFKVIKNSGMIAIRPYYSGTAPTWPVTFKVGFTATENYEACSVDITITA